MRLRQVALAARTLEAPVADLCWVLGVEVAFRDPGVGVFGLENAVMPLGETFLEVVSPLSPDAAAGRWLDRNGGDGGYMVILQTEDLPAERRRIEKLDVRIAWDVQLENAASIHLHPKDVGGAILSLDAMQPPESWAWAGPDWRRHIQADGVSGIVGVELCAPDPRKLAERWAGLLACKALPRGEAWVLKLSSGELRFLPEKNGRRERLAGVELRGGDAASMLTRARERGLEVSGQSFEIAGTRFRIAAEAAGKTANAG